MTEGERWAQELLARLAAGRYRLRAWWRLLADSFARATETRRARRRDARVTMVIAIVGVGAWTAGTPAIGPAAAATGAAWWLLVIAMVRWHLGMLESPDGIPARGLGPANLISLARLGAVPLPLFLGPDAAAIVLAVAAASDVTDGWLARARGEVTRFGHWVDGSADTLMFASGAIGLAAAGSLPGWAAGLVMARATAPWVGVTLVYFAIRRPVPAEALVSGRIPGAVLVAGLVASGFGLPGGTVAVAAGAVGGLLTWIASSIRGARLLRAAPAEGGTPR